MDWWVGPWEVVMPYCKVESRVRAMDGKSSVNLDYRIGDWPSEEEGLWWVDGWMDE